MPLFHIYIWSDSGCRHAHYRLIFGVKRGIMSTLTLISDFGQINEVEKFKFDLIQ